MSDFNLAGARTQLPTQSTMFHEWVFPDGTPWTRFYRADSGYLLRFPDLADFEVSEDGHDVRCWPVPGISEGTAQHLFLNQVQPLILGRQGKLVFHASAVEIGDGAVAFIGESGRGKSTLAASFATSGFRFLTDEGLIVEYGEGVCRVTPSHPSIRLWDDSEQALVSERSCKAPPLPFTTKARFLAGEDIVFCDQVRPLHRVYFLGDGFVDQPVFELLKPAEALIGLVKNSFLLDIEAREFLAAHFDELSRLVSQDIYYRLDYPRSYEDLVLVRQAIVYHATNEENAT